VCPYDTIVNRVTCTPTENVVSHPMWSWGEAVARKPTDTVKLQLRLEEGLRRRLEREARWRRRSMNAEIVSRLQESFDIPDQAQGIAEQVASGCPTTSIRRSGRFRKVSRVSQTKSVPKSVICMGHCQ
jgi:hypothetical protein